MTVTGMVSAASAGVALLGALGAVGFRNIFHNILCFALAMLGVAGVFLGLGADFVAVVFVLVYVGAVAIAMVYAVMLSQPLDQAPAPRRIGKIAAAVVIAATFALALWRVMRGAWWPGLGWGPAQGAAEVGRHFLTDYVLAFELVSVLLVVAMMGAVMVARRTTEGGGRW